MTVYATREHARLHALCDPDRPGMRTPWQVDLDGVRCAVATDGHLMVALEDVEARTRAPDERPLDSDIERILRPPDPWAIVRAAASRLLSFTGSEQREECLLCKGTGFDRCLECLSREDCCECEGDGYLTPARPALFGRRVIDLNLLARVLEAIAPAPDTIVSMQVGGEDPESSTWLGCMGARAAISPMRASGIVENEMRAVPGALPEELDGPEMTRRVVARLARMPRFEATL